MTELEEVVEGYKNLWATYRAGNPLATRNYEESITTWLRLGLSVDEIVKYLGIAIRKDTLANAGVFKYGCGIVWKNIKAQEVVEL